MAELLSMALPPVMGIRPYQLFDRWLRRCSPPVGPWLLRPLERVVGRHYGLRVSSYSICDNQPAGGHGQIHGGKPT